MSSYNRTVGKSGHHSTTYGVELATYRLEVGHVSSPKVARGLGSDYADGGDYDPAIHHVGLGYGENSLWGFVTVGPRQKALAGPVFEKPSDVGTDDLIGNGTVSTWTQEDWSGGEFQEDWGKDVAMFSECQGMLPSQLSRTIRTTLPVMFLRPGHPTEEVEGHDIVSLDVIDEFLFVVSNTNADAPYVGRLNPGSPSGAGMEVEGVDMAFADDQVTAACWNKAAERLWLGTSGTTPRIGSHEWRQSNAAGSRLIERQRFTTPGLDLAEPTLGITGIHLFGEMKFVVTAHGDGNYDDNIVWLFISDSAGVTKWQNVGHLPGRYVCSVTYNNAVYILTRLGSSNTQLSMTQGDQIFPVLDLPYFFQGQSMVEYAGRLYIAGVGHDLEGNTHHGELHEVNGTSLRLVRTFAPEFERLPAAQDEFDGPRDRSMRGMRGLCVAEGLLWMPDAAESGLEVYDATTDSFYGAGRLRGGPDETLEFTKMVGFADSVYIYGTTSLDATTGFYRTERRADLVDPYTSFVATSDFHPEPSRLKSWSRFATLTRNRPVALEYSTDSGQNWTLLTPLDTLIHGNRYEQHWSLVDVPQSQAIRFKMTFTQTGAVDEPAAELITTSLSFLVRGEQKLRWKLTVNASLAPEGIDGPIGAPIVEQAADGVARIKALLWRLGASPTTLRFADTDGQQFDVVITDIDEQQTMVSEDGEAFIGLTLLEI